MRNTKTIHLFYLFFLAYLPMVAQSTITPERLTIKDGLSQGFVYTMLQDQEGFLWFGTKNGLNRYDGNKFEIFSPDPSNPYSISDDHVLALYEMEDFLLIGTAVGGLNIFHKPSKRFFKTKSINPQQNLWTSTGILNIRMDRLGQCWIHGQGKGPETGHLVKLNFPEDFWQRFPKEEKLLEQMEISHFPNFDVRRMPKVDSQYVHVVTELGKLLTIDIATNKIKWLAKQRIQNIKTGICLNIQKGIMAFNWNSPHEIFYLQEEEWLVMPTDFQINALIYLETEQQLWVTTDKELLMFENWQPSNNRLRRAEANFLFDIPGQNAKYLGILKDRSGILWLSTNGYGLIKINPRLLKIKKLFNGNSIAAPPFILEDNTIVVSQQPASILSSQPIPTNSNPKGRSSWFRDKRGKIWLVNKVNRAVNRVENTLELLQMDNTNLNLKIATTFSKEVSFKLFAATIQKEKDLIWIASPTGNLIRYQLDTKQWETFSFQHLLDAHTTCHAITMTDNGHWWIGTTDGLVHGKPIPTSVGTGFDFELLQKQQGNSIGLLNSDISTLLPDPTDANILWIGSKGGGLHRLDITTMQFSYLNSKTSLAPHQTKLPNDVIYGVLNDAKGNLWMSSNRGIIRYNVESGILSNFSEADGMQNDEFNTSAYAKAPTGELMFGGINGLNVFNPADLTNQLVQHKIYFTSLSVNNQAISVLDSTDILSNAIGFTSEITLPYSKNSLSIEFADLEFSDPSKNRFRYYLEGAEAEWDHEGTNNKATYLNLNPGTYTFKVMGANGDRISKEEATELQIKIFPPWYRSNLAYGIYSLLLGGIIWQIWAFQNRRLQLQHTRELEQLETARLKELDETKSKFYTNITHEFRTPLTVISGVSQQMKMESLAQDKMVIKRNSDQLLNLVNQMLDLRKLESGLMKIENTQSDLIKYLRYLTESLKSYAQQQGINIHFLTTVDKLVMDFDAEKIARIHANLLSNAIKFTPKEGDIYLQISKEKLGAEKDSLLLAVKDTGVGIPKDKLDFIFDRFYQVDDNPTREGTGIGLTLVSELIKAMDGTIAVSSTQGEGTTFSITLPITNLAPLETDVLQQKTNELSMVEAAGSATQLEQLLDQTTTKDEDRPSVLIVEDNADVIHYLLACLKETYNIAIAMNGEEGIETAIENSPDLIISDVMMPIKDGFELCQTLKTDERTSHIPIILLTAKADIESRIEGLEKGADAYLSKPFHKEELLVRLKNQLKLRQKLQARYAQFADAGTVEDMGETIDQNEMEINLDFEDAFLQKIKALVEKDLSDAELSMPQLMRGLGMSRSQIFRKVKALTGHSPSVFIRDIRLFHAQNLLKSSDYNISEVAYAVGFTSPGYFSDVYLKKFGQRPNATRK